MDWAVLDSMVEILSFIISEVNDNLRQKFIIPQTTGKYAVDRCAINLLPVLFKLTL